MDIIYQQSDENTNQGICYKIDTEIYPVMLLTFLISIWKVFLKATPKNDFFLVTTLWLTIDYPVWAWKRNFKPIGRYKDAKNAIFNKNKVLTNW